MSSTLPMPGLMCTVYYIIKIGATLISEMAAMSGHKHHGYEVVICVVHIYQSCPFTMTFLRGREGGMEKGGKERNKGCRRESRAAGVASAEPRELGVWPVSDTGRHGMEHDAHYALFITREYSTLEAQICFTSRVGFSNSMSVTGEFC